MNSPMLCAACFWCLTLSAGITLAKPVQLHEFTPIQDYVDIVGDVDGSAPAPGKAVQDTIGVSDWTFDEGSCNDAGWLRLDNRILSDGFNRWAITGGGTGGDGNQGDLDFDGVGNHFDLAHAGHDELKIFDVSGRQVRTLVNAEMTAGQHRTVWYGLGRIRHCRR